MTKRSSTKRSSTKRSSTKRSSTKGSSAGDGLGADSAYRALVRRLGEVHDLGRARAMLAWDERTVMPPGGAEARAEQLATLERLRHDKLRSPELGRLLGRLEDRARSLPEDSDEAALVRIARRDHEKARRVPGRLRAEIERTASIAHRAWVEARARSDFGLFLPHLERNFELARRYVECFEGSRHPYDPLLDDYEPEMTTAAVAPVLDALKRALVPLVAKLPGPDDTAPMPPLHGRFPASRQKALVLRVLAELPLDPGTWRLDESAHPFATSSSPQDVRVTTRYDERYLGTALFGALHEAGHALYEGGVASSLARTPLGRPASLGLHESQSRTWENLVGRGRPFSKRLLPLLRDAFPGSFASVDAEALHRAVNEHKRSLIRVEADEVTYDLHIALRFELELELFEGRLAPRDLPEAWNAGVKDYLALEVPSDADGVLQDVHWAEGSFGYFPTYSLGNVAAAQLWKAARRALPDLDEQIAGGELVPLRQWLRENLHRHGRKLTLARALERITGGPLDVAPYLSYLRGKSGELREGAVT